MGKRVLSILAITLAMAVSAGAEVPPDARQRDAEVEVARLAEMARVRYGRRQLFEEVRTDSGAIRVLEKAYGPLHPRVIEHLGVLLDKHGGHLLPSTSLPLASWMLDKLEAIHGTPPHVAKGIGALVGYWRWAVDIPGYAINRLDYSGENVSFGLRHEGEAILQRTLDLMEKRLGAGHSDLAAFRRYMLGERLQHLSVTQALELRTARAREINEAFLPSGSQAGDWRAARQATVTLFGPDDRWLTPLDINEALRLLRVGEAVEAARLAESAIARMDRARVVPPVLVATGLVVAGGAYVALGAHDKAELHLQRAIGLLRPYQGERWALSLSLSHGLAAAGILAQQRRPAEALELVGRIVSASREEDATAWSSNKRQTYRETQLLRARLLRTLDRPAEAVAQVDEILAFVPHDEIQAVWRRSVRPLLLVEKARALLDLGRLEEATAALREAEPDLATGGDGARAALLEGRARLAARSGRLPTAILLGKMAVGHLQSVRHGAVRLDPSLERGFVAVAGDSYQFVSDLLIETGRLAEAQQMLALLKDDEFDSFTRRSAGGPVPRAVALSEQEAGWESRYREIEGRVAALAGELDALRGRARRGETLSGEDERRRDQLENDLRTARIAFDAYLASLMGEFEKDGVSRGMEVGAKNLDTLRSLQGTLRRLGHGAVVLHYLVTHDRVRLLLTTPSVQIARETRISSGELSRKVQAFRRAVGRPSGEPDALAEELHRLLVEPVQRDLDQAGASTLMLSLDGVLRYLPFAALRADGKFLVERYRLALYSEAARDKLADAPEAGWRFVGLGVTRPMPGFAPLPAVKEELEGILRAGGRGVLPGEVHFDDAFDRRRLRDALDRGFPVLHVASHFVFEPGTDVSSFLLLGDGSRLSLREIRESNYSFSDVDLVTLSACDTASFGGRDATGREVEGLGAMLQKQGARSVVATLWPVSDESTGSFMREFYRLREQERLTKAEALRRAQLAFIHGTTRSAGGREYAHPFHWAPFILMGNWN